MGAISDLIHFREQGSRTEGVNVIETKVLSGFTSVSLGRVMHVAGRPYCREHTPAVDRVRERIRSVDTEEDWDLD